MPLKQFVAVTLRGLARQLYESGTDHQQRNAI
jgi:hypothetical protein